MDTEGGSSKKLKSGVKTADMHIFVEKDTGNLFSVLSVGLLGKQDDQTEHTVS